MTPGTAVAPGTSAARPEAPAPPADFVRSGAVVAGARFLSMAASLVRSAMVAAAFGAGRVTDAFFVALFVPETIQLRLMGPLIGAFVPVLVQHLSLGDRRAAGRLIGTALLGTLALATAGAVAGFLVPGPLVAAIAPGFEPETQALAAGALRLLLPLAVFTTSATVLEGVLSAHRKFAVSALAPVLGSAATIACLAACGTASGVQGLALAFLLGGVVACAIQVPAFLRLGFRPERPLGLGDPAVRRILWLMLPIFGDQVVGLVVRCVENNLASRLDAGSISALGYALRLHGAPVAVFALGLGIVALPALASHHAREDGGRFRETAAAGLRCLTLICVPIAAFFLLASRDLVRLFYQYGSFDAAAVEDTARVLRWLTPGLLGQAAALFLCRALYAQERPGAILWTSAGTAAFNVAWDLATVPWLGVNALALGASLTWLLYAACLHRTLVRAPGMEGGWGLRSFFARVGVATGVMAAAVGLGGALLPSGGGAAFRCAVLGAAGLAAFLPACAALGVREVTGLLRRLRGETR